MQVLRDFINYHVLQGKTRVLKTRRTGLVPTQSALDIQNNLTLTKEKVVGLL